MLATTHSLRNRILTTLTALLLLGGIAAPSVDAAVKEWEPLKKHKNATGRAIMHEFIDDYDEQYARGDIEFNPGGGCASVQYAPYLDGGIDGGWNHARDGYGSYLHCGNTVITLKWYDLFPLKASVDGFKFRICKGGNCTKSKHSLHIDNSSGRTLATINSGYGEPADSPPTILLQNQDTGRIGVWHMNALNVGQSLEVTNTPGPGWKVAAVTDYNNDGQDDFVLQHQDTRQIAVWQMSGLNVAGGPVITNVPGPGWKVAGVTDHNNDGQVDFVLQHQDTRQIAIWQMSGLNVAGGGVVTSTPGPGWKVAGVADYNNDGQDDFVLQQQDTRQIAIWQMSGLNVAGGPVITNVPGPGWKVAGVGDYNNDGQDDFVLQQQDTRQVAVWQMSGANVVGGGVVTSTPSPGFKVAAQR
jgi:hypothetical protein